MRLLNVHVIVNEKDIYPLKQKQPITIPLTGYPLRIVVSDGFHITPTVVLGCNGLFHCYYKVGCAIDDAQLVSGCIVLFLLYGVGYISDVHILMLSSLIPIFYFLYLYYINRKDFIRITVG